MRLCVARWMRGSNHLYFPTCFGSAHSSRAIEPHGCAMPTLPRILLAVTRCVWRVSMRCDMQGTFAGMLGAFGLFWVRVAAGAMRGASGWVRQAGV